MHKKNNAALGFIFITLLVDCIGIGIMLPVLPDLLKELTHGSTSDAARYGGWLTFAISRASRLFCAPIIGGLSDKYGRRPVLLASLLGLGIDYIFISWAPTLGLVVRGAHHLRGIRG